ncbi:anthranilate phosphoribosyltransferase [Guptibacillus hwajinpoensis]|uniref:Anthranilate phosphoribosyltransferase n=1 Tax=Guptibacillus hwajinpoensis TaxID=208199 RepID=A0A0J6CYE3_9BACL|nr:anthranilate phosphoribosyltransferase [Alkalihalobacillus macyae]KMM38160.1 anthranilate phosphoribosyltransferase [Alkalihalobacillus macyae]
MFKEQLQRMIEGATLSESTAEQVMDVIMEGKADDAQIASFLTILQMRGESVDELTGFVRSLRNHVIQLDHGGLPLIDTCGTGGDGQSTFNISTASAILVSSLGVKVAKHGNRAVSSKSGSADVLDELAIPTQSSRDEAIQTLEGRNMCFLFAPNYHTAMKHAVSARKAIGFRTVFNSLGPLANPAGSQSQLIGVYSHEKALKMAEALKRLGTKRALLVTGGEGMDECSISTYTDFVELKDGELFTYRHTPEDVGLRSCNQNDLRVDTSKESATLIQEIFNGNGNEASTGIVLYNAGAALYLAGASDSIKEGVKMARDAINNGTAKNQLNLLRVEKELNVHA